MTNYETLLNATEGSRAALMSQPIIGDVAQGQITADTYHRFLHNAYHHVRHTVPLMLLAGARLTPQQAWLQPLIKEYVEEETGHERWVLNDLRAAAGDDESCASGAPYLEVDIMVRYVRDYIERDSAIGFFGMVLVLEGTSTSLASAVADQVQETLGFPNTAFSYLRSHGALDEDHVVFFEKLVNKLSEEELEHVTHVAHRVYQMYGAVLNSASCGKH